LEHIIEGIEPLARFDGVEFGGILRSWISHRNGFLSPVAGFVGKLVEVVGGPGANL
jgi:hypothetical protein